MIKHRQQRQPRSRAADMRAARKRWRNGTAVYRLEGNEEEIAKALIAGGLTESQVLDKAFVERELARWIEERIKQIKNSPAWIDKWGVIRGSARCQDTSQDGAGCTTEATPDGHVRYGKGAPITDG
jgi:hypothetical protein